MRARAERQILVLSQVKAPLIGGGAWISVAILSATLGLSIARMLPLHVAALLGAVLLVISGCVPVEDLYKKIDWLVMILLGGMLALGKAFDKYGLAERAADLLTGASGAIASPHVVLGLLLLTSVLLAQTTTSIATAVILTPVAMSIAAHMGVSDRPFLMAVLTGTNCAFMSPVAHPANAMVVGPGGYRFRDFIRVGAPLTALIVILGVALLPVLWPFAAR